MATPARDMVTSIERIAFAGIGAAVAGPIGYVLGGFLGYVVGGPTAQLVHEYTKNVSEKVSETIFGIAADSIAKKIKGHEPRLESVYREALRRSLKHIRKGDEQGFVNFSDWFDNWDRCLSSQTTLKIEDLLPKEGSSRDYDHLFVQVLQRLDAQGRYIAKEVSIQMPPDRKIPEALLAGIKTELPPQFKLIFNEIIVRPENELAWKEAGENFKQTLEIRFAEQRASTEELKKTVLTLQSKIANRDGDISEIKSDLKLVVLHINELKVTTTAPAQDPLAAFGKTIEGVAGEAWNGASWLFGQLANAISGTASEATQRSWDGLAAAAQMSMDAIQEAQKGLGMVSVNVAPSGVHVDG